ncbi:hypothetical protein ABZ934_24740 [Streptomyces sp. NPDC046557]|uniref:hypothetical protein n=1 Tax=Streptomyces sp. NPDC046557 TaxID=3155372 RepID=UPI0033FF3271
MSVTTVRDGGLYDVLLPEFEATTGYRVQLSVGEDVYGPARAGEADIVLSHFGHKDVDTFVMNGYGHWPRTVLSNLVCLLGPSSDPAGVRGSNDLVVAFQRIAQAQRPLVVNNIEGMQYLAKTIAIDAQVPDSLFLNDGLAMGAAMDAAAAAGGYVLWGLTPFRKYVKDHPLDLEPLLLNDPALQRIMVTTVVNPAKVHGVNEAGATALQDYLLSPETQAKIRAYRIPGIDQPVFWPAGRHNQKEFLATPQAAHTESHAPKGGGSGGRNEAASGGDGSGSGGGNGRGNGARR